MAQDWDEIKKLAADLQRAQLGGTIQKLSERNCIEIVNYLVSNGFLKVIYTTDGKEYLTHKQLERELDDELYVSRGRISLSDLAVNLNVDYSHVEFQAQQLAKRDSSIHLVLGQLVNSQYLDDMADQLNEKLQVHGTLSISTLAKDFNLPSDFLFEEVIKRLGKFIEGFQDEYDPKVILTAAYMSRYRARIKGALTSVQMPMPVSLIVKEFGFEPRMFFNLTEEMIRDQTLKGSLTGGRSVGKATYIPSHYAKAQNEWIENFYAQNGYLEYDAVARLGISDPKATIKRKFPDEKMSFLGTCCIGDHIRNIVEIQIEEALATHSYVDVVAHLPSVLSDEDSSNLLTDIMRSGKFDNAQIFCETIVVSKVFLTSLQDLFKSEIQSKATALVESGKYGEFLKKQQTTEKLDMSDIYDKGDKKEERRKKAAEGKAGGGAQGRETKTKSAKNKKKNRKQDDFSDDEQEVSFKNSSKKTNEKLEFMSLEELEDKFSTVTTLRDAPEDLNADLAKYFSPIFHKGFHELLQTLHQSTVNASMVNKRRSFQEFQDKMNTMIENLRLFEKGLAHFEEDKDKLEKYLLKSLCHEFINEAVLYACQEHQISCESNKDLNVDQRNKLIGQLPKDVAQPMALLNKSLDKVQDFVACIEDHPPCDIGLKKTDRKKDRQIVFNHRQNLMQQIEGCQDPALTLHLAVLILFQCQTGCMLHASGKFVPQILSKVSENLEDDAKNLLQNYQQLVVDLMSCKDPEEKGSIQKQLEEQLRNVKDAALNAKKSAPQ